MWQRYELIHDLAYFSPQVRAAADAIGMRGFWMGYFAMRAAPLGAVEPAAVTATFFGFHHSRVERALPDAWRYTTPDRALAARLDGVERAMQSLPLGTIDEAAHLLWAAAESVDVGGRPLGAANKALPRPASAAGALWQATATLREHRGDGHIAVLVARGVTPAESHHLKIAAGESDPEALRVSRRFPDDEWQRGRDALAERGWFDADDRLTEAGRRAHDEIESATDALAAQPWAALGEGDSARLLSLLDPLARQVVQSGLVPPLNPVGLVWEPAISYR